MSSDRFDRQNRVYGIEGTQKIQSAHVSIVGPISDLTYEIAKNLALSGINHINLDLSSDIVNNDGSNRLDDFTFGKLHLCKIECIIAELKKLNPYVVITETPTNLLTGHVVILVNSPDKLKQIDENDKVICFWPENGSDNTVVYRFVADLKNHLVTDIDGENYELQTIESIKVDNLNSNVFNIKTTANHNLDWGSIVTLRLKQPDDSVGVFRKKIKSVVNSHTFSLDISDINNKDEHTTTFELLNTFTNGYVNREKEQLELRHLPITTVLDENKWMESFNEPLDIKCLSPLMQYYMGALLSSEAIKAITSKYLPVNQIMDLSYSNELSFEPSEEVKQKLANLRCFMVGSGAIGCELLKNLVSIGTATSVNSGAYIKITDPDHIEVSNLSRQFLFRSENVSKSKSETARDRIKVFAPNTNIIAYQEKLSPQNQAFVDEHFSSSDIVLNALDNLAARLYVDTQCVKHTKPLFESGTLGTKGNTQPVIPHITESYGASRDLEQESSFPACTIKNFPTLIQHTIHWAMDDFDGLFVKQPQVLKQYLEAVKKTDFEYLNDIPQNEQNVIKNNLNRLINKFYQFVSTDNNINPMSNYVFWACEIYKERFIDRINRLLKTHPEDSMTDGKLFWSNGKKCPKPINNINISNETTLNFIIATTLLLADTYAFMGLSNSLKELPINNLKQLVGETVELFNAKTTTYCDDPDLFEDIEKYPHDDYEFKMRTLSMLGGMKFNILDLVNKAIKITPQEFEKDYDLNNHILFVQSDSNSRAENYDIPKANFYETKGIAGKIIPALATTTSIVSSLIVMELVKYLNNPLRPIADYASTFINLASNFIIGSEPMPPSVSEVNGMKMTQWGLVPSNDNSSEQIKFESDKSMILSDFIKFWTEKFNNQITMVCLGSKIIYMEGSKEANLNKTLEEIIGDQTGTELCLAADDDSLELPDIKVI
jgi:molybdopterin/thiamine biosynthesis adenylyltransferase